MTLRSPERECAPLECVDMAPVNILRIYERTDRSIDMTKVLVGKTSEIPEGKLAHVQTGEGGFDCKGRWDE